MNMIFDTVSFGLVATVGQHMEVISLTDSKRQHALRVLVKK